MMDEVIKRTEQENRVGDCVRKVECAAVAERNG